MKKIPIINPYVILVSRFCKFIKNKIGVYAKRSKNGGKIVDFESEAEFEKFLYSYNTTKRNLNATVYLQILILALILVRLLL